MKFAKSLVINQQTFIRTRLPFMIGAVCGLLFLLLGAGCTVPVSWDEMWVVPTSTTPVASSTWQGVAEGIARFDQRVTRDGVSARLVLWKFAPEAPVRWSLAASTTPQTVRAWADQFSEAGLIMNAGYFHPDFSPSGWVMVDGKRFGERSFDPERTGIVSLGDHPKLVSGATPLSSLTVDAFQSYPWLIDGGKMAFTQETGQYARRSFVAMDKEGNWYVGVVPTEPVTLYQLARLLQTIPVSWERALGLDGGSSTGLMTRFSSHLFAEEDRFDSFVPVPYVIVASPFRP